MLVGQVGGAAADLSDEHWRLSPDSPSVSAAAAALTDGLSGLRRQCSSDRSAAAAIPLPLGHTVELNAGTMDTDAGPGS
ncbi:hypothetical protein MAHJHV54_48980 [Mycobacterium avium subsp. hominissuis]